eukprot:185511_1
MATKKQKSKKNVSNKEEGVRVAIRVRPFNSREKRKNAQLCVSMPTRNSCTIWNTAKQKKKTFKFDYCYWSTNAEQPQGFTKQEDVFADLGHLYVDNAFKGYNSSVFAYGQTGSGKTFTMLGTAKKPGLIPRGCEEIFRRIEQDYSDNIQIEIEASYLEVYMDQIFDLLADPEDKKKKKKKKRQKLAIRFHPKKGPFVQGLTKHAVGNYRDIQKLMNVGLANRTVAETQMNKISSRSHCIFTLYMNQYQSDGAVTASKINLIDLAGSERVNKTGAMGQRMEELKKINKSLSALGDVISALADHAKFVPYNNSVLTTLLSESLGGNSKTIMMAAISPADDNFDESLSTLRYAERVKKIKQIAKKNRGDSKATVERELRSQIDKLKRQLDLRSSGNKDHANQLQNYLENSRVELRRVKMEHKEKVDEMRDTYTKMKQHLASMGLSSVDEAKKSALTPKLINISGDPSLSGSMVFFITNNEISIGAVGADIGLQSDGDILDKHAVIKSTIMKQSRKKKAMETRLYVWKLLFNECDANKDGFLNKTEFDEWSKQVLQSKDFKGFGQDEYDTLCADNQLSAQYGVSWEVVRDIFATEDDEEGSNDKNVAEILGIPKKKMNEQLINDLKCMIFEEHSVLTLKITAYHTISVDFQYDLSDSDIQSFQQEIRSLFEGTKYGQKVQFVRPNDPQLTAHKQSGNGGGDVVTKQHITLESANPTNNNIMIFVNKERVRYNPKELHHGDHILFGTRHIFQFIDPANAASFAIGDDDDEKKQTVMKHEHVTSLFDMKNIMSSRLQTNEFRIGNVDINNIQKELLKQRQDNLSNPAGAPRSLRDAFMEDYQVITHKANNANQMSLHLDKQVLFDVGTLSYFDKDTNSKLDRIIVTRTCHYSDPELQRQMELHEFESLIKNMGYYHELAAADGENVAAETLDDDPFIPRETETLLGEARLKLSGRKMPKDMISLPINTASGDTIGQMSVEVTFKLIAKNETNCYDMKKMENKQILLIIGFEQITTQMELPYVRFSFCGVGKDIITISNKEMGDDDEDTDLVKSTFHKFEDSYEVPSILVTPSFKNYLSAPGLLFKIWAPVFDDVSQMPPIIAHKIRSKKLKLNILLPDGETLDLVCKTGNTIGSLKRKIEFRTEIADYQQKLYFERKLLDNVRTLLDYNIDENDCEIKLEVEGTTHELQSMHVDKRTSLFDLDVSDLQKELTNPNLSKEARGKIRRIKNKSIHMAFLKDDLVNATTMTLESYQAENAKLREELIRANTRIEQLERELAKAKSKGSSAKKSKVFGSWRRGKAK